MSNNKALDFLKNEGLISEGYTTFNVRFNDGTVYELVNILTRYSLSLDKEAEEVRQKINCDLPELLERCNQLEKCLDGLLDDFKYHTTDIKLERAGHIEWAEKLLNKTK